MIITGLIKKYLDRHEWRKLNTHNKTYFVNAYDKKLVTVGKETYGPIDVEMANMHYKLQIGHYCSIAEKVKFILSVEHSVKFFSTYPFKAMLLDCGLEGESKGDIIVDDDVWIGYGATIMSGVHIGQGAVVAAGAVVTKDVPTYAIVGGVPAKVIKYRFEPELVQELLKVDYSKLDKDLIIQNKDRLYEKLQKAEQLDWLPKRHEEIR